MKPFSLIVPSFGVLACAASVASAQVLMLDFGPTAATDTALTNSPYHTVNPSFAGSTWNTVGVADVTSGLKWSDGSSATSVTLNLGATTQDSSTTVGLANTPSNGSGLTGTAISTGVYAGTSVARDGIFTGTNSGQIRAVGLQIGGLAAGTYTVYVTGRNTNTTAGQTQNFYVGKSATEVTQFNFLDSGYEHKAVTFFAEPTTQENQWSTGALANYAAFSVTLSANEYLHLAVKGGSGDQRGFLNMIQIVGATPIPEPSSAAFGAGVIALLGAAGARRRRR